MPATTELLHLSADPHQLGRSYPTRWASAGDAKATLAALLPLVVRRIDASAASTAVDAVERAGVRRTAAVERLDEAALARYRKSPTDPMAAIHALMGAMPPDSFVVDEAISTSPYVRGFHRTTAPGRYFFNRGAGLGWGMPVAVGVSLGHDGAPVLGVVGDGSAMYSPQALWTAAHEGVPVVFAVVNNRQYLILKNNLRGMGGDSARTGRFVGTDLVDPPIDFVALAHSMGVDATLVEKPHDIREPCGPRSIPAVHISSKSRSPADQPESSAGRRRGP